MTVPGATARSGVIGVILLALLLAPAPLLPAHRLAEALQSALRIEWPAAYLFAALGLHAVFYGALGLLASLSVSLVTAPRARVLQFILVPLAVMAAAMVIRSLKLGGFPTLANFAVPLAACFLGAGLGLGGR